MREYNSNLPLIFLHIPKTAGTFFRDIIVKEYSEKQCLYLYYPAPYSAKLIAELQAQATQKKIFYGHVSYGIHSLLNVEPQYITFFREPIERVVSFYLHNAKHKQAPFYTDIQSGMSLLDMLESGVTHEVNNHLTRIIAHESFPGKLEDLAVLEKASKHIEQNFCFVGLTEQLETSIHTLEKKLTWRYHHSIPSPDLKTQAYLKKLDKITLAALNDYNYLDLLLYSHVKRLFHHEVKITMSSSSPSVEESLTEVNFDNEYYFSLYPDVAAHPAYQGVANGGWLHWIRFGKDEGRKARIIGNNTQIFKKEKKLAPSLIHRGKGYKMLTGHGLEIGALHQPAQLPNDCTIEYCDAASREELSSFFPELNIDDFVKINYICDLDKQGLSLFKTEQYDFLIINHVIEHVANPIKVIEELFRILKRNGKLVISAPDKDYTFDKHRGLTSFEHLLSEYKENVTTVTDAHYLDFLKAVHPELMSGSPESLAAHIQNVRNRREHAHVWDSLSFQDFMKEALNHLNIKAECLFLHTAEKNHFEYFSVWQKY